MKTTILLKCTHLRLLLGISEQVSISRLGRSIPHHSGGKNGNQVGEGHLVGSAVVGHPLQMEDEVGQRVLVGRGELGDGLKGRR